MARLPFTDAHVHFFDVREPSLRYDWCAPDSPPDPILGDHGAIKMQRYWADDFIRETRFQNVGRVIHAECAKGIDDPVRESRWLQGFADRLGIPHGAVAQANLAAPNLRETLERHMEFPIVRGIRDPDNDAFLSDPWRKGYALLEEFDLVCCHHVGYENMEAARALIEKHPGITFCVDHAGFPLARDPEYFEAWRTGMATIGQAPNAVVKISGLGMVDHAWTVDSIRPWVLACIAAFGTERSFFATNWVVDKMFSSYGDVLNAYEEIIAPFSEAEQRALFSENANRIFRLQ